MSSFLNQRANPRFRCRCYARLDDTSESWPAHLINLSQRGALVAILQNHNFEVSQAITLFIELENEGELRLSGTIAHINEHYVGINCDVINERDAHRLEQILSSLDESHSGKEN